jgi:heme/copper-type cytochrome/quinol oxidase subunit 3
MTVATSALRLTKHQTAYLWLQLLTETMLMAVLFLIYQVKDFQDAHVMEKIIPVQNTLMEHM